MAIYVMSDIHGLKSRFDAMITTLSLQEEDKIYILGDIIDRGKDGIAILQSVMKDDRFTLIMGNHELMMLEYYEDQKEALPNEEYALRWARNGCTPTMEAFQKCTEEEQEAMLSYLKNCPLAISDVIVRDKVYYLVHGAPILSLRSGNAYLHSDFMKLFSPHDFVWNRLNGKERPFEDRCVIVGHTITSFYQMDRPYRIWSDHQDLDKAHLIDMDCGCACDDDNTQLACLRLDDLKVFYE